jgi:hypothetical protein
MVVKQDINVEMCDELRKRRVATIATTEISQITFHNLAHCSTVFENLIEPILGSIHLH